MDFDVPVRARIILGLLLPTIHWSNWWHHLYYVPKCLVGAIVFCLKIWHILMSFSFNYLSITNFFVYNFIVPADVKRYKGKIIEELILLLIKFPWVRKLDYTSLLQKSDWDIAGKILLGDSVMVWGSPRCSGIPPVHASLQLSLTWSQSKHLNHSILPLFNTAVEICYALTASTD